MIAIIIISIIIGWIILGFIDVAILSKSDVYEDFLDYEGFVIVIGIAPFIFVVLLIHLILYPLYKLFKKFLRKEEVEE